MADQGGLDAVQISGIGGVGVGQGRCDGRHEAVGEENARERTNQRGRDQVTENFRRLGDRAHGHDNAQHGGDNPESRGRVGHALPGAGDRVQFFVVFLQLNVHDRFQFVRIRRPRVSSRR